MSKQAPVLMWSDSRRTTYVETVSDRRCRRAGDSPDALDSERRGCDALNLKIYNLFYMFSAATVNVPNKNSWRGKLQIPRHVNKHQMDHWQFSPSAVWSVSRRLSWFVGLSGHGNWQIHSDNGLTWWLPPVEKERCSVNMGSWDRSQYDTHQ